MPRLLPRSSLTLLALLACSSSGSSEDSASGSDHWFHAVIVGEDGESSLVASVDLAWLDPYYAGLRAEGTPALVGELHFPDQGEKDNQPVPVSGTFGRDGSFEVEGGGWSISGSATASLIRGGVTGPAGEVGLLAGVDASSEPAARYCGSYDGDVSGDWSFALSETGLVVGALYGELRGELEGSGEIDQIGLTWTASDASSNAYSGGATGALSATGQIAGSWEEGALSSLDGGTAVKKGGISGTWTTFVTCPGAIASPPIGSSMCKSCDEVTGGRGCCGGKEVLCCHQP